MPYPKPFILRARKLALPIAVSALALAISWAAVAAPPAPTELRALVAPPRVSDPHDFVPASVEAALSTLAPPVVEPVAATLEEAVDAAPAAPVASSWQIGVTAFGWQAELDACQWVLMDMVAEVTIPIVAAHNYCGGGIVLEMQVGDTVTLGGYGVDGVYVVTGDRQAWSGSDAASAISGMDGDIILQTCYWDDDGTERLVSLQRVG